MIIKLYGSKNCHKSNYYRTFLEARNLDYVFLDVTKNDLHAEELRNLYKNRKLNFPTLLLDEKKNLSTFLPFFFISFIFCVRVQTF